MSIIHSAGAVLYTVQDGQRQYVLVREKNGSYGLPKGHVEAGETLAETALREVREETGILAELRCNEPVMVDEYPIAGGDTKRVSWFIARYTGQTPAADRTQVLGVLVRPIEAALATLTYNSTREILRQIDLQLGKEPPESPADQIAISCSHVLEKGQPVLHASHDADDGVWQLLCGRKHLLHEARVVALSEVLTLDDSLQALLTMPCGCTATRKNSQSPWRITKR